jgi:predicted nucleotide-binding protein
MRRIEALKLRVERMVGSRPIGQAQAKPARYFDPRDVEPVLAEWKDLCAELVVDSEFKRLSQYEEPGISGTADFEGRGYIERTYLQRLLNDLTHTHDLLAHPSRANETPLTGLGLQGGSMVKDAALSDGGDSPDAREVFIVHGRDAVRTAFFFDFVRRLGLRPLEFDTLIARSGVGAPYIGDIIHSAFKQAAAVVVLFTGDDLAQLKGDLVRESDPPEERTLTPQPRANVLFEAGMALALHRERTIIVEIPPLRGLSDLHGMHVVRFSSGSASERNSLLTRLRRAGCDVIETGNDWLSLEFPSAHTASR